MVASASLDSRVEALVQEIQSSKRHKKKWHKFSKKLLLLERLVAERRTESGVDAELAERVNVVLDDVELLSKKHGRWRTEVKYALTRKHADIHFSEVYDALDAILCDLMAGDDTRSVKSATSSRLSMLSSASWGSRTRSRSATASTSSRSSSPRSSLDSLPHLSRPRTPEPAISSTGTVDLFSGLSMLSLSTSPSTSGDVVHPISSDRRRRSVAVPRTLDLPATPTGPASTPALTPPSSCDSVVVPSPTRSRRGLFSRKPKSSEDDSKSSRSNTRSAAANHVMFQVDVPQDLVVDASGGKGVYRRIASALMAARDGQNILVMPGTYEETFTIDKNVHIVGQGDSCDVIIRSEGPEVIRSTARKASLRCVTIRHVSRPNSNTQMAAVDIDGGALLVDGCDISSTCGTGVYVHNDAAPTIQRCEIHGSMVGSGIECMNSTGTIRSNDIYGHWRHGIEIRTGGNPVVQNNVVRNCGEAGILVSGNGRGCIEDNELVENRTANVAITTGGDPLLHANLISRSEGFGIHVFEQGVGTITDNVIIKNKGGNVKVHGKSKPSIGPNTTESNSAVPSCPIQ